MTFPRLYEPPPDEDSRDEVAHEVLRLMAAKEAQAIEAKRELRADYSKCPDFCFPSLVRATGPLLKGQLWTILAREKNGKSSFVLNVMDRWLRKGVGVLYFGTEEAPSTARRRFAAIRTGNNPSDVLEGKATETVLEEVEREIDALDDHPVYFVPDVSPSWPCVRLACLAAVEMGIPIVVLDHFHRMAIDEHARNQAAELGKTVANIKKLAVETGLTVVMAAQAKRGTDPMSRYHPPPPDGGLGTSKLEQESDGMLGLYKPLVQGVTPARQKAFLAGEVPASEILRPNTMGVRVLHHRRNGDLANQTVFLHISGGLMADGKYLA